MGYRTLIKEWRKVITPASGFGTKFLSETKAEAKKML